MARRPATGTRAVRPRPAGVAPGTPPAWKQRQLSGGLASLERAMRLGRLRQRELVVDAELELAALEPAQHLARPLQQLRARDDVVSERRPGQEQRALLAQQQGVE